MKLLLVGTGGYAANYVKLLLEGRLPDLQWEGIVDPYYSACSLKDEIDGQKIPVYATMEEFYAEHSADLAVISTPTFLHRKHSICAVANGSQVLCEKPVAPTVEDALHMLEVQKKYGRFIAIGYQWSYSEAICNLKADIARGVFGKPLSFKTAVSWPRNRSYYSRGSGWAGRISKDGIKVLDSIASNACAHYLHNMLYLLGDRPERSASAVSLSGECYRANPIENFDTCCIKMKTSQGTDLYFAATHAAERRKNPAFVYTFEKGTVLYSQDDSPEITAVFENGKTKVYGDPFKDPFRKLQAAVEGVKTGIPPVCTVKTAIPHVEVIEKLHETVPIFNFAPERVVYDREKDGVFVKGLFEALYAAYAKETLFSETDPILFQK